MTSSDAYKYRSLMMLVTTNMMEYASKNFLFSVTAFVFTKQRFKLHRVSCNNVYLS